MRVETAALNKVFNQQGRKVHAVRDAFIRIEPGETVGLWGASGSGKSTLARLICGLDKPTSGTVLFDGRQIRYPFDRQWYRHVQIIFQHPEVSFNPRLTLERSLMEPYRNHRIPVCRDDLLERMRPLGLYAEHLGRYPAELSGGELQRAAILRALTLNPSFIILDEPTSMLDSISQAQIMNLLMRIQAENGTSFLLISHARKVIQALSRRIYRVENGNVMEI